MPIGAPAGWSDEDQAEGYRAAWRSFQALARPAHHRRDWAAWAGGRSAHVLLVVPIRERRAVADVQRRQAGLARVPGVELHPAHFLHVSVQSFGFLRGGNGSAAGGDLDVHALGELIPRLARGLAAVPAFALSLGQVNAFHSSVFLETWSAGRLLQVQAAARAAAHGVLALQEVDPYPGFLFHLTLGYLDAATPLGPLRACLRRQRELERERERGSGSESGSEARPIRLRVNALELVSLPADQREPYPAFECLARFTLRPASPAPVAPVSPAHSRAGQPAP